MHGATTGRRLLLINPALTADGGRLPNVAGAVTMEPLGLAYVAALTPRDWEVRLWDEVVAGPLPANISADLVGISVLTATAPHAYELAGRLAGQGMRVVLGGPHPTVAPEEAARHGIVFCGEAEQGWPQVIADYAAGRLQEGYEGGTPDLQGMAWPRRDVYRQRYVLSLVAASRGCSYRCEFCAIWKLNGGTFRLRPVDEVLAELAAYRGGRATLFTDDNILACREWAAALFRGMAERGLRRRFAVQASLSIADDDELLSSLSRAGCFAVMTGLESVSEESLRTMRKGVNLKIGADHYREKIAQIHRHGMIVAGTFMFGNDGDEADIFRRTVEFVLDAGLDLAHFGIVVPDPGTDLHARLAAEGRLLFTDYPGDYRRHHLGQALFVPRHMTTGELEQGTRWAAIEISRLPVAFRRAFATWRATGDAFAAVIALAWTRSGLAARARS